MRITQSASLFILHRHSVDGCLDSRKKNKSPSHCSDRSAQRWIESNSVTFLTFLICVAFKWFRCCMLSRGWQDKDLKEWMFWGHFFFFFAGWCWWLLSSTTLRFLIVTEITTERRVCLSKLSFSSTTSVRDEFHKMKIETLHFILFGNCRPLSGIMYCAASGKWWRQPSLSWRAQPSHFSYG